ncbi:MAG: GGDEF domain-containing protein [Candidatus Melainabacteria bacterium]|nr:GGDEF domain-containing protein [Candidatus Melainabacteria bacterium]
MAFSGDFSSPSHKVSPSNRPDATVYDKELAGSVTHPATQMGFSLHRALQQSLNPADRLSESLFSALLSVEWDPQGFATREIDVARAFSFELPTQLTEAIQCLEQRIGQLTRTHKNVILVLDEQSGAYTCINDDQTPEKKPRELTRIADNFLEHLLEAPAVLHTYLFAKDVLVGIVAIAEKEGGQPFDLQDELTLELVARYLAPHVRSYQSLKQSIAVPYIQRTLLEMSHHLVGAVDQDDVFTGILRQCCGPLPFSVGQYIALKPNREEGQILYEYVAETVPAANSTAGNPPKPNATAIGLQKIGLRKTDRHQRPRLVKDFAALVSLFTSGAWTSNHLLIHGNRLGDKALKDLFGVPNAQGVLLVPVLDKLCDRIAGVLALFITTPGTHIAKETIEIVKETAVLVAKALARTQVLERALALANSDELTGLTNRRGFYDRFETEVERARRNNSTLCVAMLDVDHFKQLNDRYGHLQGDRVLQALADLLRQNVRRTDVICRFGGEEFALLLPDTPLSAAVDLLERIRRKVEGLTLPVAEAKDSSGAVKFTVSAGVVALGAGEKLALPSEQLIPQILAEADEQLYLAKSRGRNLVCAVSTPTLPAA